MAAERVKRVSFVLNPAPYSPLTLDISFCMLKSEIGSEYPPIGFRSIRAMVISVASQKGGTGKTTTSISLAAGLARRGKRVLLVDTDSQANSSKVLLPNYVELHPQQTLYATILERSALPIHTTSLTNLS